MQILAKLVAAACHSSFYGEQVVGIMNEEQKITPIEKSSEKVLSPELLSNLDKVIDRISGFVSLLDDLRVRFTDPAVEPLSRKLQSIDPSDGSNYYDVLDELSESVKLLSNKTEITENGEKEQIAIACEALRKLSTMVQNIENDGKLHKISAEITFQAERMSQYDSIGTVLTYFLQKLDDISGLIARLKSESDTKDISEYRKTRLLADIESANYSRIDLGGVFSGYAAEYAKRLNDVDIEEKVDAALNQAMIGKFEKIYAVLAELQVKKLIGISCYSARPAIQGAVETLPSHFELDRLIEALQALIADSHEISA